VSFVDVEDRESSEVAIKLTLNREAVTSFSPGLPPRLPWGGVREEFSTATRLRVMYLREIHTGATASRFKELFIV
jgi:hypothetical protein